MPLVALYFCLASMRTPFKGSIINYRSNSKNVHDKAKVIFKKSSYLLRVDKLFIVTSLEMAMNDMRKWDLITHNQ